MDESDFIRDFSDIDSLGFPYTWIGISDFDNEGSWITVFGETLSYSQWAIGEPNNQNDEDFGLVYSIANGNGMWNDGNYFHLLPFVVEFDFYPPNILWSTGETSPSITVSPSETTTYSVTVTQGNQTCTSEITIEVLPATTYYADADGDGYGNFEMPLVTCEAAPQGYVLNNDDCNDGDALVYAGAVCDDGDACTMGDVYTADCSCAGTFADEDNDGICDAIDNCVPTFINPPANASYQCSGEVPAYENLTASDCCGGNVVEQFGSSSSVDDTLVCNQVATPQGPGQDWGLWVNGLYPSHATTDWYRWVGAPSLVFSNDGEARLVGDVVAIDNAANGWHVDMTLEDGIWCRSQQPQ